MKYTTLTLSILALSFLSFTLYEPTDMKIDMTFQYLVSGPWDLKQIEVNGYTYSDSVTTDMQIRFGPDYYCTINNDTVNLIPWAYGNNKIYLAPNTPDQQIWNINYLDTTFLIYNVDYTVEGNTHNYVFKFMRE